MKKNTMPALLLLLVTSCTGNELMSGGKDGLLQAHGYIAVQVTGEHTDKDLPSDDIKTIRFIVFTDLATYPKAEVNEFREVTNANRAAALKALLGVSRTAYASNPKLVVAIANEPDSLNKTLNGVRSITDLERIEMDMAQFVSDNHLSIKPYSLMPMSGALWIDKSYATPEAAQAASHKVELWLERAVARVDVYLTTDIPGVLELLPGSSITLNNTYTQSLFVHHQGTGNRELGHIQMVSADKFAKRQWYIINGGGSSAPGAGGAVTGAPLIPSSAQPVCICTFYTPERNCRKDKLIIDLSLQTIDGEKNASITLDNMYNEEGDLLPIEAVRRNNRYIVRGNVRKIPQIEVRTGIEVLKWNEGLDAFPLEQYYLKVDKSSLAFPETGGVQAVVVDTNQPDGWKIEDALNLPAGITAQIVGGTVQVTASPKTSGPPDTQGWFTIRAGNLRKIIYITQTAVIRSGT